MTDNSRTVTATLIGAVLGAIAGYLFFTDRGRRMRRQIDQALDEVARELDHACHTLNAVVATAYEGGPLLGERLVEQEHPPRNPSAGPTRVSTSLLERPLHDVGVTVLRGEGDIEMTAVK